MFGILNTEMSDISNDNWLTDFLRSYKECFESLNSVVISLSKRVEFTEDEVNMLRKTAAKYKNMIYHVRKVRPDFNPQKK